MWQWQLLLSDHWCYSFPRIIPPLLRTQSVSRLNALQYRKILPEENKVQVVDTGLQVCFRLPKECVHLVKVSQKYPHAFKRQMMKACGGMEEN